jgi:hypothetical protein
MNGGVLMTDNDLMLEQLGGIHASAADLAALSAALRVTLVKLRYPISLVKLTKAAEGQTPAEDQTEAQQSFMWGPHAVTRL